MHIERRHRERRSERVKYDIMKPFQQFARNEASSSILLMGMTVMALIWANSPLATTYHHFWETELHLSLGGHEISRSLRDWIDEGLMAFFFFTVGLEIKREILVGELASMKRAFLPVGAAIGGMAVPALIFLFFNSGLSTAYGWGIPMATDIAFSLGVLFILGKRVPIGIRVFLSAFAIADDLGSVFVIAVFYTKQIFTEYLLISAVIILFLAIANYMWVRKALIYSILGILLWLSILASGVHATVAGIIVAMFIPARARYDTDGFIENVSRCMEEYQCPPDGCGDTVMLNRRHLNAAQAIEMACHNYETPLQRLEHALHPWVAFLIIPLFALANVGVTLSGLNAGDMLFSPLALGITLGLVIGKPVGITLFAYITVRLGIAQLADDINWCHIVGAGILGGIGFTMSLFVSSLSFADPQILDSAKIAILTGSIISGITGLLILRFGVGLHPGKSAS
ncbi:MAG: Na+/H+ antiporter NhaA [Nitrospirota bacterium]|nr:MAG: Na+/H+ antiporter NhaA [Nitrospirota bacterium]